MPMVDGEWCPTISDVTAELVARGIPRSDHGSYPPERTVWWVWDRSEPSSDEVLANLVIAGVSNGIAWQMGVFRVDGFEEIAGVNFIGGICEEQDPIGTLSFWPGLDAAIAMCQSVTSAYLKYMDGPRGQDQ